MENVRTILDDLGRKCIEKIGNFINPVILEFKKENGRLLVFYFHGFFKTSNERDLNQIDPQNNMTVGQFADFIDYFQNHNYKFISQQQLDAGLQNDEAYAMITFDDGYFNNMFAVNILNQYQVPAVIFISTKNIMENKAYWWDIIYKYRSKQDNNMDKIRSEQKYLKKFKHPFIDDYIRTNFGKEAFIPWSDIDRPLNKEEVMELSTNSLISFGNHTHNHAILTNYSKEEIKEELRIANKLIFQLTNSNPTSIAFPNGNYNNLVLEATEEEEIKYAFTTQQDKNVVPLANNRVICLNRYMTNTSNISKFGSFCRLGYDSDILYNELKTKAGLLKRKLTFAQ